MPPVGLPGVGGAAARPAEAGGAQAAAPARLPGDYQVGAELACSGQRHADQAQAAGQELNYLNKHEGRKEELHLFQPPRAD